MDIFERAPCLEIQFDNILVLREYIQRMSMNLNHGSIFKFICIFTHRYLDDIIWTSIAFILFYWGVLDDDVYGYLPSSYSSTWLVIYFNPFSCMVMVKSISSSLTSGIGIGLSFSSWTHPLFSFLLWGNSIYFSPLILIFIFYFLKIWPMT